MLTRARLKQALVYVRETGEFIWRVSAYRTKAGDRAGSTGTAGYVRISLDGQSYAAHRLAWFYVYGKWPEFDIDHIDGQPGNNAIDNLRDVPRSINSQNRAGWGKFPKGVYRDGGRYRAMLQMHGKLVSLGTYSTVEEAEAVVSEARMRRDLLLRGISLGE
jgi:hypothetical protein